MKLKFLGGVNEVGRLGMLLETDKTRALFDYGIAPHDPPLYPEPAPEVDALFLSHAHIDHSGFVPWAARKYEMPVIGTPVTRTVSELLAHDSLKVCRLEGYPQPFDKAAIHAMTGNWYDVDYGDDYHVGDLGVTFHSAGHIPGSTMFKVDDGSRSLLFTGDINLVDTRLCAKAQPVRCDTLVVEATYAGRQHPDRKTVEETFLDAVDGVIAQGGTVVIPAFATGRTQEILMLLSKGGYEVWLDGMGKTVSQLMLDESGYLRSARELSKAFEGANLVKSRGQRERALKGDVIVTTSGMMEGGPVITYMNMLHKDPESAIFFTGFQVPGSGGRKLLDTGTMDINGTDVRVNCEVKFFNFSAHAGHDHIVEFAKACHAKDIVLFHSDKREPLAEALQTDDCRVHLPVTGEVVDLD